MPSSREKKESYLSRLRFDPKLLNGFIAKYLSNPRLAILILLMIVILGVSSYLSLPRNLNPEIKIPIVIVSTVLPGAGPKDVESLVTIPIENGVNGVQNIKKVTSTSRDSVSIVQIEFNSGVDPEKARGDTQTAVDGVNDLPKDAQTPKVQKLDFENQPVWIYELTSKYDLASLTRFSKTIKDQIDDLQSIDRTELTGLEDQEVQLLIKPDAISTYSINPQLLAQSIKTSLSSFPAGAIKSSSSNFSLTLNQDLIDVADFRDVRVNLNSQSVQLSQIADISLRSKPDQFPAYLITPTQQPKKVVTFNVFRNKNIKIDDSISDVQKLLDQKIKESNDAFSVLSVENVSDEINTQFNELTRDFIITISLVFITLLIFLGLRQAVVSSLAIPLTFFISFTVMRLVGISLSFIAYFSLLLALGLLVDDTIVVISAMTSYFRTGKFTPLQTALLVWRDFVVAVFTTTITTVWAFLPLLLSTGIIGEFIKPIPIVVSTTLVASFFVAMFITLPFLIILLTGKFPKRVVIFFEALFLILILAFFYFIFSKNTLFVAEIVAFVITIIVIFIIRNSLFNTIRETFRSKRGEDASSIYIRQSLSNGFIHFERFSSRYRNLISKILSAKKTRLQAVAFVLIFTIFSFLLLPLGFVQNEFFPKTDQDFIFLSLELPPGTTIDISKKEALDILNQLKDTPELEFATANIGQSFNATQGGTTGGDTNNVLFSLKLHKKAERKVSSIDIGEMLRNKFKNYQRGNLAVTESTGGPPAGADIQIKLFGDDLTILDQYASRIEDYLKSQNGVTNIDKSIKPGTSKVVFVPDKDKLIQNNLSSDTVGFWLRTFASGFNVGKIKLPGDRTDTDINLRLSSNAQYIETVSSINIPTQTGNVPILSVGSLQLEPNPTLITREKGKRTLSVTASVKPGFSTQTINKDLESFATNKLNLPAGYSWATGGVNEENQNSVNSILQAMVLSFLLIIITMVVQFNSFRKALIVMLVIPLSISGVLIIFALTHTPLSFPALIGVLALFGIVVKNSILIVDKITQNQAIGMEFRQAIVDGASSRLEAIALTSFATIMGLIPVTLSDPIWRGLGGAIIAGLTFSGTIMLFFIPNVYYYLFNAAKKR